MKGILCDHNQIDLYLAHGFHNTEDYRLHSSNDLVDVHLLDL